MTATYPGPPAQMGDGLLVVELTIEPSEATLAVIEQREQRAESLSMARLLTPRSVAVIGASRKLSTIGHQVLRNLLSGGFVGPVYPVNPNAPHVASVKTYPTVLDIPDDVDLAVVAVPAAAVAAVVDQCAQKGVKGLVAAHRRWRSTPSRTCFSGSPASRLSCPRWRSSTSTPLIVSAAGIEVVDARVRVAPSVPAPEERLRRMSG